jgi:hypothetical protein
MSSVARGSTQAWVLRALLLASWALAPVGPGALADPLAIEQGFDPDRDTPTHSNGFGVRWRSSRHYTGERDGEYFRQMGGFCMGTSSLCQHVFEPHRRDAPQAADDAAERLRALCSAAAGREQAMLQAAALQTQLPRPEPDYFVRPASARDFLRALTREIQERGSAVITYVFLANTAGSPPRRRLRPGWFEAMGHSVVAYQVVDIPGNAGEAGIRVWDPNFERGFPWQGGNGELVFTPGANTLAFSPRYRTLSIETGPPGATLQPDPSLVVGQEIWLTVVPRQDRLSALERIATSGLQVTDSGPPGPDPRARSASGGSEPDAPHGQ